MRISIKDHLAQEKTRAFIDVQTQALTRFNHVLHVHLCVAVLSIKYFQEERQIIGARRAQPEIFDRGDFLFERDAQFFFLERLFSAKFDDAGAFGSFFLLLHDRPARPLLLFWPHNINGALRCDFKSQGHCAEGEEDSVSHVSETE